VLAPAEPPSDPAEDSQVPVGEWDGVGGEVGLPASVEAGLPAFVGRGGRAEGVTAPPPGADAAREGVDGMPATGSRSGLDAGVLAPRPAEPASDPAEDSQVLVGESDGVGGEAGLLASVEVGLPPFVGPAGVEGVAAAEPGGDAVRLGVDGTPATVPPDSDSAAAAAPPGGPDWPPAPAAAASGGGSEAAAGGAAPAAAAVGGMAPPAAAPAGAAAMAWAPAAAGARMPPSWLKPPSGCWRFAGRPGFLEGALGPMRSTRRLGALVSPAARAARKSS